MSSVSVVFSSDVGFGSYRATASALNGELPASFDNGRSKIYNPDGSLWLRLENEKALMSGYNPYYSTLMIYDYNTKTSVKIIQLKSGYNSNTGYSYKFYAIAVSNSK